MDVKDGLRSPRPVRLDDVGREAVTGLACDLTDEGGEEFGGQGVDEGVVRLGDDEDVAGHDWMKGTDGERGGGRIQDLRLRIIAGHDYAEWAGGIAHLLGPGVGGPTAVGALLAVVGRVDGRDEEHAIALDDFDAGRFGALEVGRAVVDELAALGHVEDLEARDLSVTDHRPGRLLIPDPQRREGAEEDPRDEAGEMA